jgi:predicted PolB exonuclease-like 3'-5' exonuclease
MNYLYLDLESIPDQTPGALEEFQSAITAPGSYTKPESIQKWLFDNREVEGEKAWLKTSFDGSRGEILCIGWTFNNEPVRYSIRKLGNSEVDVLEDFYGNLATLDPLMPIKIVGHNVKDFDLRFLFQRSVILGVQPSIDLGVGQRYPAHVYDTMTEWAGFGNRISLDRLCKALGITCKSNDMDGSKVWPMAQAGLLAEIGNYCMEDVEAVRLVHQKMTFMRF